MKKRTLFLAAMVLSLCIAGCGSITQTKDNVTIEAGEELSLKATDFFDISEDQAGDVSFDVSGVDINTVGTYEVTAAYKNSTFTITVTVEDTTAPTIELTQGYAFTNDIASCLPEQFVGSVADVSDYTLEFTYFKKFMDLFVLDEAALTVLEDGDQASQEELAALTDSTIPTEEGLYLAIIKAEDAYGNASYAEASIILDTTAPVIEYTGETSFTVEEPGQEPEIDLASIVISDNADGDISAKEASVELTASEEEGSYDLHIAYTDRAGNTAEFPVTITARVKEEESNSSGSLASNSGGSGNSGSSGSSGGGSGNFDDSSYTAEMKAVVAAGEGQIVRINDSRYGICSKTQDRDALHAKVESYLNSISLYFTSSNIYHEDGYTFVFLNCEYRDVQSDYELQEGEFLGDW